MEKLDFDYGNVDDEIASNMMISVASKYIELLNLPPFSSEGLELARSEKEINKCVILREKLKEKLLKNSERTKEADAVEKQPENKKASKRRNELTSAKKAFKKSNNGKSKNSKSKNFRKRK